MTTRGAKALGATPAILACGLLLAVCGDPNSPDVAVPAAVQAAQGANETVQVAASLTLAARVTDGSGAAVSGATVHWSIASGGGTLASTTGTTDDTGVSRVVWTVGTTAGTGEAHASVAGVSSSASFPVTLEPGPAAAVTLSDDTARFTALDDTATYAASAEDAYGNDAAETITWAVDDDGVATVSAGGLVTAIGPGDARVTATSGVAVDTLVVLVSQEPVAVALTPAVDTIASGGTMTFQASAADANGHLIGDAVFVWASSDTTVAVVDGGGVVEGRVEGAVTIMATTGEVGDSAMLTVTAGSAASVSVSPTTASFAALGDTATFAAAAVDAYGNPVSGTIAWTSTDTAVVAVDASGLATAVGNGTAGVVGRVSGVADTVAVTVQQVATQVTAEPGLVALTAAGDTVRLTTIAVDANAYAVTAPVTWTSTDPAAASVTNGLVEAVADGATEIVAALGAAADTVPVSVLTGQGVARGWTGVGGADWLTPTSWTPAGRPNAADTARILSGMATSPVLGGDAAVRSLVVYSGATLDLDTHILDVAADIVAAGTVTTSTGSLLQSGTGSISGSLPALEITGTAVAADATTITGGLRLLGGTLRTLGKKVTIQN